jgi:ADP-ribose pyrophosphatase
MTNPKKLTNNKWLNLFETETNGKPYFFCSRKKEPLTDNKPDAVVIVAYKETDEGLKLIVIKEFRVAIGGYEFGLPAGLIDENEDYETTARRELKEETGLDVKNIIYTSEQIYNSAGMTDESVIMVFVTVTGTITSKDLQDGEHIYTLALSDLEVAQLMSRNNLKMGAKAWFVMDHFARTGKMWV